MKAPIKFDFERFTPAIRAIPAIPDGTNSRIAEIAGDKVKFQEREEPDADDPLATICYTPNGKPILVLAKDEAHKAFLLRMNPKL